MAERAAGDFASLNGEKTAGKFERYRLTEAVWKLRFDVTPDGFWTWAGKESGGAADRGQAAIASMSGLIPKMLSIRFML